MLSLKSKRLVIARTDISKKREQIPVVNAISPVVHALLRDNVQLAVMLLHGNIVLPIKV